MRSDVALEHCNGRYLDKSAVENLSHTRKNRVHTSIRSCWFVPEASQTDQKSGPLSLVVVAVSFGLTTNIAVKRGRTETTTTTTLTTNTTNINKATVASFRNLQPLTLSLSLYLGECIYPS